MKSLWLLLFAVVGCTYNTVDPAALNDLRGQVREVQSQQAVTNEAVTDLQKRQSENDAKIRVMWQHGVTK